MNYKITTDEDIEMLSIKLASSINRVHTSYEETLEAIKTTLKKVRRAHKLNEGRIYKTGER